jgi:DNA adenine methylase
MTGPAAPFAYFGGKTRLAERIVELLPDHGHYVEPFAGSLAVLLAKPRSDMETVNDLDQDLMTFWRVLREQPDELALHMALTPHSRAEQRAAYDLDAAPTDLERARRVWVLLSQGRGNTLRNTGWRYYSKPAGSNVGMPGYLKGYASRVPAAAERLAGVSLECRDALEVVTDYGKHADVLLYCDPPYLGSTRSANYRHEMTGAEEHRALAAALHDCAAAVVLSGYHSPLYDDLYDGWHRAELKAWTGNGIRNGATKTDGDRIEVLWSNRPFPQEDLLMFEVTA